MTNILIYDTETTGIFRKNIPLDHPDQPHLVQLSALVVDPEIKRVKQSLNLVVKPDRWVIPPEVVDIHGISTEEALDTGLSEKLVLETFLNLWNQQLLVGHNEEFDRNIISTSIARMFGTDSAILPLWLAGEGFCTMKESKPIVQAKTKNGRLKYPRLTEAYEYFFGHPLARAHSANADAVGTMEVYFALLQGED